jgi:hypothetical protein
MFFKKKKLRGDLVVEDARSNSDPKLTSFVNMLKTHGVTDDDIRWWWNMPDRQHQEIAKDDNSSLIAAILSFKDQGMTQDEAIAKVKKDWPRFTIYEEGSTYSADDFLPYELKRRLLNPLTLKRTIEGYQGSGYSSVNKYIREQVKDGKL